MSGITSLYGNFFSSWDNQTRPSGKMSLFNEFFQDPNHISSLTIVPGKNELCFGQLVAPQSTSLLNEPNRVVESWKEGVDAKQRRSWLESYWLKTWYTHGIFKKNLPVLSWFTFTTSIHVVGCTAVNVTDVTRARCIKDPPGGLYNKTLRITKKEKINGLIFSVNIWIKQFSP